MRRPRRRGSRAVVAAVVVTTATVLGGLALAAPGGGEQQASASDPAREAAPRPADPSAPSDPSARRPSEAAELVTRPRFDRGRLPVGDSASLWVIVNKARPIRPRDYRPRTGTVRGYEVARPVVGPLTRLLGDSDRRGLGLRVASAFRSYDYQRGVYDETVGRLGQDVADTRSARPGHSEHQTGLAVDLVATDAPTCDFEACFGETPGGRWVARNAWRHGFVVRYQEGDTAVTGYAPEPWHLRYVGRPLAAELRRTGVTTLEEFFDLRGGGYAEGG